MQDTQDPALIGDCERLGVLAKMGEIPHRGGHPLWIRPTVSDGSSEYKGERWCWV